MSLVPFTSKNVELKVVTVNGKPWTCAKEVCKALEYSQRINHVIKDHCTRENYAQKYHLTRGSAANPVLNWPSDSRKNGYYLNEEGMYELVFSSQQPLAKEFRKHCCNVMFPHIRKELVDKMQEDHQKAIEQRDTRIQAIEYENVGLQGEITAYQAQLQESQKRIAELVERYVDYCRNPIKTT